MRLLSAYGPLMITALVMGYAVSLQAQSVAIQSDRKAYEVGDEIHITLSVDMPQTLEVLWPDLEQALEGMELMGDQTDSLDGQLRRRLSYLLFDTGEYVFPPQTIRLLREGDTLSLATAALGFRMGLAELDSASTLRPIAEPLEVSYKPIPRALWYAAGALLLLLLAALFYRYVWMRRPKTLAAEPAFVQPELPCDELALQKLQDLEERKLWQQGQTKEYHIELTDIIREYIEARFQEPALESTTEEILSRLILVHPDRAVLERLGSVLRLADLVKFAKARPLSDQHSRAMQDARAFVLATRQEPAKGSESPTNNNGTPEPGDQHSITPQPSVKS